MIWGWVTEVKANGWKGVGDSRRFEARVNLWAPRRAGDMQHLRLFALINANTSYEVLDLLLVVA